MSKLATDADSFAALRVRACCRVHFSQDIRADRFPPYYQLLVLAALVRPSCLLLLFFRGISRSPPLLLILRARNEAYTIANPFSRGSLPQLLSSLAHHRPQLPPHLHQGRPFLRLLWPIQRCPPRPPRQPQQRRIRLYLRSSPQLEHQEQSRLPLPRPGGNAFGCSGQRGCFGCRRHGQ